MTKQSIFDAWAPRSAIWSRWAKPVLFSQMDSIAPDENVALELPFDVSWAVDADRATALVVDLPGAQGITVALSLAAMGYRPVPLYNACPAPAGDTALVNVRPIMIALASAAASLQGYGLPDEAPPAFLLDANRNPAAVTQPPDKVDDKSNSLPPPLLMDAEIDSPMAASPRRTFDNRSISLPTDFPSANYLLSRGIRRIVLIQSRQTEPQADLSHSLLRWQQAGLTILAAAIDEPDPPRPITVKRPRAYRLLWYNLLAKLGLRSNPLGGFGGFLPMPSSG
jgi:hypothetical protein